MTTSRLVLFALIGVVALVVVAAIIVGIRSRIKVDVNSALVRTGFGGMKIETRQSKTVLCLPLLHQYRMVRFISKTVDLEIGGGDYASTRDGLSVNCQAVVSVSSLRDKASILEQMAPSQASSPSGSSQEAMLHRKAIAAVKRILSARDYADLAGSLSIVDQESLAPLASRLETQGLTVERIEIDNIRLLRLEEIDESDTAHQKTRHFLIEKAQQEQARAQQQALDASGKELEDQTETIIADGQEEVNEKQANLERESKERELSRSEDHKRVVGAIGKSNDSQVGELQEFGESSQQDLQAKMSSDQAASESDRDDRLAQAKSSRDEELERIEGDKRSEVAREAETAASEEDAMSRHEEQQKAEIQQAEQTELAAQETEQKDKLAQLENEITEQRAQKEAAKEATAVSRSEAAQVAEEAEADGSEQLTESNQDPE
jgi:uncharacterized membrane protein YqiK